MTTTATTTATAKPKRPVGSKQTKFNLSVSLDLADVVRVAGWNRANHMLNRLMAFASNRKGRISLKVTKPKKG